MHIPHRWQETPCGFNKISVVDRGAYRDLTFDKFTGQGLLDGNRRSGPRGAVNASTPGDIAEGLLVTFRHRGSHLGIYDMIVLAASGTNLSPMICCQMTRLTTARLPVVPIKADHLLLEIWSGLTSHIARLKQCSMYKGPPHTIILSRNGG